MKKIIYIIIAYLFYSCNENMSSGFIEIPVDIEQDASLPFSVIAEELIAIELELTDESLINSDRINRIIFSDNEVIIAEDFKIYVFSKEGKFLRTIGSRGQGPGEYNLIMNFAFDKKNGLLFVNSSSFSANGFSKILCYNLNGKFLKYHIMDQDKLPIMDINFINDKLFIITENIRSIDSRVFCKHSVIYELNNDFQIIDSIPIRDTYFGQPGTSVGSYTEFLLPGETGVSLYFPEAASEMQEPLINILRDTLYILKNNCLIPDFKLNFKNNGIDNSGNKFILISNIYRSSRYFFALYTDRLKWKSNFFCYDTKTGTGYNMQDGFTDDIKKTEKRIRIHPLNLNPEFFYYWHTHMNPDELEEPNPTLYIGKLKK